MFGSGGTMDIELIEAFSGIVETGSFTMAAESLHITQSALSHRIARLEKEVGAPLILRGPGKRGYTLTQAGEDFIPLAEEWLRAARDTEVFKDSRHQIILPVGTLDTLSFAMKDLFTEISKQGQKAGYLYDYRVYPSPYILDEVEKNHLDFGIVVRYRSNRHLRIEPLFSESYYLVAEKQEGADLLDPAGLDRTRELVTGWDPNYLSWRQNLLGSLKCALAIIDTRSMLQLFMEEPGTWCIVPKSSVSFLLGRTKNRELRAYRMPSPPPDRTYYKVRNTSPHSGHAEGIRFFESKLEKFCQNGLQFDTAEVTIQ